MGRTRKRVSVEVGWEKLGGQLGVHVATRACTYAYVTVYHMHSYIYVNVQLPNLSPSLTLLWPSVRLSAQTMSDQTTVCRKHEGAFSDCFVVGQIDASR